MTSFDGKIINVSKVQWWSYLGWLWKAQNLYIYSVCSRGCLGVPGLLKLSAGCLKLLILSLKGVQLFKQIIN